MTNNLLLGIILTGVTWLSQ